MKSSAENYLKLIFIHQTKEGTVKPNLLAKKLEVSTAAVTDMFKRLFEQGFIDYSKYKGARLTPKGEAIGKTMVRRHRMWEMYLHKKLGFAWDKVHEEADRLEHASSDDLIDRLEEELQFPLFDPHGDPIPSKDGLIPTLQTAQPLSTLKIGQSGKVIRVSDFDNQFLIYINQLGVYLDQHITLTQVRSFDQSCVVDINGTQASITQVVADNIFVHPVIQRINHHVFRDST